jgi:hypothetical protein
MISDMFKMFDMTWMRLQPKRLKLAKKDNHGNFLIE